MGAATNTKTSTLVRLGVARWLDVLAEYGGGTLDDLAGRVVEQMSAESDPEMRKGIALAAILNAYNTGLRD